MLQRRTNLCPVRFQIAIFVPKTSSLCIKDRNLEDYGTKRGYRPDTKQLGISRHIIRAIGKIRGMPKAACTMMDTVDLAIIRVQTDKCQKLYTPHDKFLC